MPENLKAGKPQPEPSIIDPNAVPIKYIDWIVTSGVGPAPGIINIALAAIDYAASGGSAHAVVQARLRMSHVTAQNIVNILQQALDALKPPSDQTMN